MLGELARIARQCDGVRCDMAMLVLPEVFERTWGISATAFWPRATEAVRARGPGLPLPGRGLLGPRVDPPAAGLRLHLRQAALRPPRARSRAARPRAPLRGPRLPGPLARFLENHDEPRAAATFPPDVHRAAAVITFFTPGLRFFHQGQREGKRVRIPVHLGRGPAEPPDAAIAAFYDDLLECLNDPAFRDGDWQLLECRSAWDGNPTSDDFVAFSWTGPGDRRRLVAVNYASHASQCYVALPWNDLSGRTWSLADRLGPDRYDRTATTWRRGASTWTCPPGAITSSRSARALRSASFDSGRAGRPVEHPMTDRCRSSTASRPRSSSPGSCTR